MVNTKFRKISRILLIVIGIFLFSYFIKASGILKIPAILGILLSVVLIVFDCDSISVLLKKFNVGKSRFTYLVVGVFLGITIGGLYRYSLGVSLISNKFTLFALVALAIGTTEELIFRGYIQNRLSEVNVLGGVLGGALGHTIYKALLFVNPFVEQTIDVSFMVSWTFIVGIVFGVLVRFSKSIWPAVLAHAIFDVVVYGQLSVAPWWVW